MNSVNVSGPGLTQYISISWQAHQPFFSGPKFSTTKKKFTNSMIFLKKKPTKNPEFAKITKSREIVRFVYSVPVGPPK